MTEGQSNNLSVSGMRKFDKERSSKRNMYETRHVEFVSSQELVNSHQRTTKGATLDLGVVCTLTLWLHVKNIWWWEKNVTGTAWKDVHILTELQFDMNQKWTL